MCFTLRVTLNYMQSMSLSYYSVCFCIVGISVRLIHLFLFKRRSSFICFHAFRFLFIISLLNPKWILTTARPLCLFTLYWHVNMYEKCIFGCTSISVQDHNPRMHIAPIKSWVEAKPWTLKFSRSILGQGRPELWTRVKFSSLFIHAPENVWHFRMSARN